MSKARELAEERFAKGEISAEELKSIISQLNETAAPVHAAAPAAPAPAPAEPAKSNALLTVGKWMLGGLVVLMVIGYFIERNTIGGLGVANLTNHGTHISLDVSNTSSRRGNVIFYSVTGNSSKRCVHVFEMRPGTISDLSFPCENTSNEEVSAYIAWADSSEMKNLAPLAKKKNVTWDN